MKEIIEKECIICLKAFPGQFHFCVKRRSTEGLKTGSELTTILQLMVMGRMKVLALSS